MAVLVAAVLAGCSGGVAPGAKPADPVPEPPAHSLLGTWTAPSTCTLPEDTRGTGTLTMTFGETRWYVYRYCSNERFYRYIGDGGTWRIDGTTVTRTRLRIDEVEIAIKELDWTKDGESFETHPFHWDGDDNQATRRTYTLVSRDTLPVDHIEGVWYVRWNGEVLQRYVFNKDGSFVFWGTYGFRDDEEFEQITFVIRGDWSPGNAQDGTLYLSNIEATGEDTRFPGRTIRASSQTRAEIGIAPGPRPDTLIIWRSLGFVPASNMNAYLVQVPTSPDNAVGTLIQAFER